MGWGGRLFEAGRFLAFSAFRVGAYSRWALIRGWALIRINTVLKKLSQIGVSLSTVNWFQSYLSDRFQFVRMNSTLSDFLSVSHGVPKAAIVSPLLFCMYMNDLPFTSQNCSLESYVDDTKVYLSFSLSDSDTAVTKLEQDLHRVATCCSWGYSL